MLKMAIVWVIILYLGQKELYLHSKTVDEC